MDTEIKGFLEGLVHGPCAGVSYGDFVKYCQREAKRLLEATQQSVHQTGCTCPVCGASLVMQPNGKLVG